MRNTFRWGFLMLLAVFALSCAKVGTARSGGGLSGGLLAAPAEPQTATKRPSDSSGSTLGGSGTTGGGGGLTCSARDGSTSCRCESKCVTLEHDCQCADSR